MNKEQLKELVKAHFNLVEYPDTEEKFGELSDENKAFTLKFPGDVPQVGDKVTVETTDGQKMDAPDGYHKMENGLAIKTEGSVITEISTPEAEKAEGEDFASQDFAGEDVSKSQVEGTTPQNDTTVTDAGNLETTGDNLKTVAEVEDELMAKVKMAIEDAMKGMYKEMDTMKTKMEEMASKSAAMKTMPATAGKTKMESFSTATNDTAVRMARELIKSKNK